MERLPRLRRVNVIEHRWRRFLQAESPVPSRGVLAIRPGSVNHYDLDIVPRHWYDLEEMEQSRGTWIPTSLVRFLALETIKLVFVTKIREIWGKKCLGKSLGDLPDHQQTLTDWSGRLGSAQKLGLVMSACVCVWERERERERARAC